MSAWRGKRKLGFRNTTTFTVTQERPPAASKKSTPRSGPTETAGALGWRHAVTTTASRWFLLHTLLAHYRRASPTTLPWWGAHFPDAFRVGREPRKGEEPPLPLGWSSLFPWQGGRVLLEDLKYVFFKCSISTCSSEYNHLRRIEGTHRRGAANDALHRAWQGSPDSLLPLCQAFLNPEPLRTDAENHRVPDWKDKLCLDFPGHSPPLSHAVGGRGRCPGEVARWLPSKSSPLEVANTGLRRAEMHASLAFVLDLHSFQENHDLCNYFLPRQ